jgi:hypothetical protein
VTPRAHLLAPTPPAMTLGAEELAIARSVLYAALFDYPLTLAQLRGSLIESAQTPSEILAALERSAALRAIVEHRDGFFFPRGRHHIIAERRRRESRSRVFLAAHRRLLSLICALPFVRLVAVSGSLAHLNLEGGGDLDLFIVTRGRHVWSTTVAVLLLAKALRRRRTVCANFVIADTRMQLEQQDLFTASQIIHLKPLIGRNVLQLLIASNPFVAHYYPNFHSAERSAILFRQAPAVGMFKRVVEIVCAVPWWGAEHLARSAYRAYLLRRSAGWRSPEQVRLEPDCLKLHTQSHRHSVLERFEETLRNLELRT